MITFPEGLNRAKGTAYDIVSFGGINRTETAQNGEFSQCVGLSSKEYPTITQRAPRRLASALQTVSELFPWDGALISVSNGELFIGEEGICPVNDRRKQFAVVNTKLIVWPDKLMIDLQKRRVTDMEQKQTQTENRRFTFTRDSVTVPMDGYIASEQRRYGFSDNRASIYTYTALTFSGGTWSKTGEQLKGIEDLHVGDLFIPYKNSMGEYRPNTGWTYGDTELTEPSMGEDNSDGVYFKVISIDKSVYSINHEGVTGDIWFTYALFDSGVEPKKLTDVYSVGEALSLKGCTELDGYNNRDGLVITAINDDTQTISFGSNTFHHREENHWPVAEIVAGSVEEETYNYIVNVSGNIGASSGWRFETADGTAWECTSASYDIGTDLTQLYLLGSGTIEVGTELWKSAESWSYDNSDVTLWRAVPDMDFICAYQNRLWGVSNNQNNKVWNKDTQTYEDYTARVIYVSELGFPEKFWTFAGTDADSYQVAEASSGDFTACIPFGGGVCFFKEYGMAKMLGDYPSNYYMNHADIPGVKSGCHGSLVDASGALYYVSPDGVYRYADYTPQLLSEKLGRFDLNNCIAGIESLRFYRVSGTDGYGFHATYAYDLSAGLWIREDREYHEAMTDLSGTFYMVCDGRIMATDAPKEDNIFWGCTFAPFELREYDKRRYTRLLMRLEIGNGGYVQIEQRADGGSWKTVHIARGPVPLLDVHLPIARCAAYEIRLSGTGPVKIRSMAREYKTRGMK